MRRLFPAPRDLDLAEVYAGLTLEPGRDRASVAVGMVASVDGGAVLDGVTATLGGAADRVAFGRLRAACDAVLVGAGTVRDEDYGPPQGSGQRRADREARGLAPVPRLVVVTDRLALEPDHRVFSDPSNRPLVVTNRRAPEHAARRLAGVAELVRLGESTVDLVALLRHLPTLGLSRVLCEGGPSLNAALLERDLVDEVFVTLAPVVFAGPAPRIAAGAVVAGIRDLELVSVHEHASELLLRYRRARPAPAHRPRLVGEHD
jgi:riboflavin-specific deaminase-like protein